MGGGQVLAFNKRIWRRGTAAFARFTPCAILLVSLAACGAPEPDYASNAGAEAWLAFHGGTISEACIITLIERYGDTQHVTAKSRAKARSDALELAGRAYAIALTGNRWIEASEKVLETAEEGLARGWVVPQAVEDAKSELYQVKSRVRSELETSILFSMDTCDFDAAHASLGIEPVGDPDCVYQSETMGDLCKN